MRFEAANEARLDEIRAMVEKKAAEVMKTFKNSKIKACD
jgi:hypothetical protein